MLPRAARVSAQEKDYKNNGRSSDNKSVVGHGGLASKADLSSPMGVSNTGL